MKRTIMLCAIVLMLAVCCYGCEKEEMRTETQEISESQDIVFVYQQVVYSDMYMNKGYFIDREGNKVSYDFSTEDKKYVDINELYQFLLIKKEQLQAEPYLSQEELKDWYGLLGQAEEDCSYSEVTSSFDRGDIYWYGVRLGSDSAAEIVLLERNGDILMSSEDPNIASLMSKIREKATPNR